MTNFATHALLGSPTASLVGKDKGDVSNRAKCAGAQAVNNAKTLAADTVVIGGSVATVRAMKKGKLQRVQDVLAKLVDKITSKLPKDSLVTQAQKTAKKAEKIDIKPKAESVAKLDQKLAESRANLKHAKGIDNKTKATFAQKIGAKTEAFAQKIAGKSKAFGQKMRGLLGDLGRDISKMPKWGKAAVLITAIAAPLVTYINKKCSFKSGQIDQKYTDKAKIEKQTSDLV